MDRIFIKGQRTIFIEFKTPKGILSKLQEAQIKKLIDNGATVHVVSSVVQGKAIFNA